jgi:exodeoxyribonuclease-5
MGFNQTAKIEWPPQQEEAFHKASRWRKGKAGKKPYFTLVGYAGTGKTTLARELSKDTGGPVVGGLGRGAMVDQPVMF